MKKLRLLAKKNNSLLYRFLAHPDKDDETVRRQAEIAHKIISTAARGIFLISLIVTLCFYPGLPEKTGVHFIGVAYMPETHSFSENLHRILYEYQMIDVVMSKAWLFYPYAIAGTVLLAGLLLPRLAGRMKEKTISDSAKMKLTQGLRLTLDTVGLIFALYFCVIWTVQILRQQPMRVLFTELYAFLTLITFFDMTAFALMLSYDERKKRKSDPPEE